ncbi:NADH dehydrogenase [Dactylonectria estremocensis]|uniref:NADH dehydrogenase n=1 Tax=Dactylonectria estremocensis TaxID=1079267 RepID=A0A9P9J542_9HYPO|nr:NADH dehydrogenase [Dactylonectria estremocensis]
MKNATACKQCRLSKRKCWRSGTEAACSQCRRSEINCSFAPDHNIDNLGPSHAQQDVHVHGLSQNPPLADPLTEDLAETYIRCIHDRPHSIFHLPTLRAAVRDRTINPGLLYAILSFGARFHPSREISCLADSYLEHSKRHLNQDIENICIENIQTCVLLGNLSAASLRPKSEALYLGIAIRMAVILGFDKQTDGEPVVLQELKRRIWWTLFVFDQWCSAGNDISRNVSGFCRTVDLPMDETVFHGLDARLCQTGWPSRPDPGLWAYMATLAQIFAAIQDINKGLTQKDRVDQADIDEIVVGLAARLKAWVEDLPTDVQYNETNLLFHRERGVGGAFAALHMGFFHYSTLLYYLYLDGQRATTAMTQNFSDQCKIMAVSQSNLLRRARTLGNCELLFPGVGHAAVVSSSVLLHTYLRGGEDEVAIAKDGLDSNFQVLKELRQYWPSIEMVVRRLAVFQDTCMAAAATEGYKFGSWVVKFLLEYHRPL